MKFNQKGFSLIEIMAVLVIFSILLVPLMSTFTDNLEINQRSQTRRSATSIADGSLYGLEKIDFLDLRTKLNTANAGGEYYVELNSDNCPTLDTSVDRNLCIQIFDTIWNNLSFDSTEYKIYLLNYNLTTAQYNSIIANGSIETSARTAIENDPDIVNNLNDPDVTSLIRVVVWVDYYDEPDLYVTLTGLIVDE